MSTSTAAPTPARRAARPDSARDRRLRRNRPGDRHPRPPERAPTIILTARNPEHLQTAAETVDAHSSAAFDANDPTALEQFFDTLTTPVDHVMVTAGEPHYGKLMDLDSDQLHDAFSQRLTQIVHVARLASGHLTPTGSLIFMGGTSGRRPALGTGAASTVIVALPTLIANLALELAPHRINLIAPGFVDTGLSATILGDQLDARRQQLRTTLPIRRVIGPDDIAHLAVHLMTNTAITGATYDIDGGQQLVE